MKIYIPLVILFILSRFAAASPVFTTDENDDGKPDQWYEMIGGNISKISLDRNFDGKIDYVVEYNQQCQKTLETFDFNYDGSMDDYYFFEEGRLIRQEIDSNYDSRIDIWVHLYKGIYIQSYEADMNFDGVVDVRKNYRIQ